jgi:pimeloyl-ACP methyl ester carboxylesterase
MASRLLSLLGDGITRASRPRSEGPERRRTRAALVLSALAFAAVAAAGTPSRGPGGAASAPATRTGAIAPAATGSERLRLFYESDPRRGAISRGTFTVWEDRAAAEGRTLDLAVVVLHARSHALRADPIFFLAGGPGRDATTLVDGWIDAPMRDERDVVLVSQRGTGGAHRLGCAGGEHADLQSYLGPMFREDVFRACLTQLSARADLTQYSTSIAMDDLDEVREALGYEKINLYGTSYGTRAALVYMRQHPERVRSAILEGVAPIAFTSPLRDAREAQTALDAILEECESTPGCHEAFPELRAELAAVLARLSVEPVSVSIAHPDSGASVDVRLDRADFAEALRVLMYYLPTSRRVPLLVHRAAQGDFRPFASAAIESNRRLRQRLAHGLFLCVTCSEDVAGIDPSSVARETAGTFLGDDRVRQRMAVCSFWPKSSLPDDFASPVAVDVPTLILSGTLDPVTSPRCGAEAARHLANARHVVVPGAHGLRDPCVASLRLAFLAEPDPSALDTSCVAAVQLPPFDLGERAAEAR